MHNPLPRVNKGPFFRGRRARFLFPAGKSRSRMLPNDRLWRYKQNCLNNQTKKFHWNPLVTGDASRTEIDKTENLRAHAAPAEAKFSYLVEI